MTPNTWRPKGGEIEVPYSEADRHAYLENDPKNGYYSVRWNPVPLKANIGSGPHYWEHAVGGRGKYGEFPLVVVREHYRQLGYTVWASEPRLFNPTTGEPEGYAAMSFPGARKPTNPNYHAYLRMHAIFGESLDKLNRAADAAKTRLKDNSAGGDPDLFVFRPENPADRFFVEVKDEDELLDTQLTCFPLVEKYLRCAVKVVRIRAQEQSQSAAAGA